jgi:TfoX/Sxy family transcriptional regulator of competence genes
MAADNDLIERLRKSLRGESGLSERRMFGGVAFMLHGNMCCGVTKDLLVLRLGAPGVATALKRRHTRVMDFTGKPITRMVYVKSPGTRADGDLREWVQEAVRFVRTLPRKSDKKRRRVAPA